MCSRRELVVGDHEEVALVGYVEDQVRPGKILEGCPAIVVASDLERHGSCTRASACRFLAGRRFWALVVVQNMTTVGT
jgi:hypothetical protein